MATESLANVFVVYAVHSLFPSDSHDEIVPTKMQSTVENGTHPFEEEEEVQTSVNCEVKFSKLGKG
jgi:hypothetical protein